MPRRFTFLLFSARFFSLGIALSGLGAGVAFAHPPRKILVVDDSRPDRELTTARLDMLGLGTEFEYIEAANPDEALEIFNGSPDLFFAAVLDVQMRASRTGIDLARLLTERRPGLPILIVSGTVPRDEASRQRRLNELQSIGVVGMFPKPGENRTFVEMVRSIFRPLLCASDLASQ